MYGTHAHGQHACHYVMPKQPLESGTPLTLFAVPLSSLEEVLGECMPRMLMGSMHATM